MTLSNLRAVLAALCLAGTPALAQPPAPPITLQEAVALAQRQGLQARVAQSALDAARWRDRAFGARLRPRLEFTGTAADLDRGINPITLPTGETRFIRQSQNQSRMGLAVTQAIPWSGTELEVGSQVSRIDLFGDERDRIWQTTPFVVQLRQEVFRPRTLAWQQREQVLGASIAERQYLEAREEVAAAAADAFFDLYAAQLALDNAVNNAAVNDTLYTLNTGRYEVGKIGENDLLQSELALLRMRAVLDGARLERDRAEAALRRVLGVGPSAPLAIAPPRPAPVLEIDPEQAVAQALRNASILEASELQVVQAKRRANQARLGNRFGATVTASVGFNQTAGAFDAAYESLLSKQRLVVGVDMPLYDWGAGGADVQAARADEARAASDMRLRREQLEEDARFGARQLMQAQRMLAISTKADTVATRRFDVAKNRYVIGRIGIGELYIAQTEKDQALAQYVQALRGYWSAYYRLRRVTLYDFEADAPIV